MMTEWYFPSLQLYLNGCSLQNLNDSFDQFESVNYSLSLYTVFFLFSIFIRAKRRSQKNLDSFNLGCALLEIN